MISVMGLGYVGLPLAIAFAKRKESFLNGEIKLIKEFQLLMFAPFGVSFCRSFGVQMETKAIKKTIQTHILFRTKHV